MLALGSFASVAIAASIHVVPGASSSGTVSTDNINVFGTGAVGSPISLGTEILDGTRTQSVDFTNRQLFDISGVMSEDFDRRGLKDQAGNYSFTWDPSSFAFPQLTSNGFLKTSAGNGTIIVDTNTYLTTAVTSISGSGGTTGLTLTGGPITTTGTLTLGGTLAIANGGTGQTTANAAFNALSPMTTGGDIIYGGASGVGTRLANGSSGQVLTSSGGTSAPTWTTIASGVSSVFGRTGAVVATSGDYTTAQVTESGNLYYTNARAIAATLTAYSSGAGTISSSDSILSAIQKLNGNTAALVTGVSSVSNSDGTLTISPTIGAVVASIALAHANTWTGLQTNSITNTLTSGSAQGFVVSPTYNQSSGTAANTDVLINRTQTAVGSGQQNLIDMQVGGTSRFRVSNTGGIFYGTGSGGANSITGATDATLTIRGADNTGSAGRSVFIKSGNTTSFSPGSAIGDLTIEGGDNSTNTGGAKAGDVLVNGGTGSSSGGGGNIVLTAKGGAGAGGTFPAGAVTVTTENKTNADSGIITVVTGTPIGTGNRSTGLVSISTGVPLNSGTSGALNLTTGSSSAGAGGAGNINILSGNGSTNGSSINITAGIAQNNVGGVGGSIVETGGTGCSSCTGGSVILKAGTAGTLGGDVQLLTQSSANNAIGNITITTGTKTTATAPTANVGGPLTITLGAGADGQSAANSTGGAFTITGGRGGISGGALSSNGSPFAWTIGAGGSNAVATGTGGNGGIWTMTGGAGGAASGTTVALGGNGSPISIITGTGGNATGASGTRTGGNGGSLTFQTGAAGTGASANGAVGTMAFNIGGANTKMFIDTTGFVGIGTVTPNSTLQVNGSFGCALVTKTANYTATSSDCNILVDSTGGVVTITLPTAVGIAGRIYNIKDWKGQSLINNITIATTSAQTIDGAATVAILTAYREVSVTSDGANWSVMP